MKMFESPAERKSLNTALFWSGGKDAAMSLYYLQESPQFKVRQLITTLNEEQQEVAMHRIPLILIQAQAEALNLGMTPVFLPEMPGSTDYELKHRQAIDSLRKDYKIQEVAFGDIFLEDLKAYRESLLLPLGIKSIYPLWNKDSRELMEDFLAAGFKALTVCVDAQKLDKQFCGREIDASFLEDLPEGVDPCGENGEFHTFVYDGPIFNKPVPYHKGDTYLKTYQIESSEISNKFWYTELLPVAY